VRTVLVACGALAREVLALKKRHNWPVDVLAVPAVLHNTPPQIVTAVQQRITALRHQYNRIIVVYGDCGTGGGLDALLNVENVVRVSGPHCYEMYAGTAEFEAMMAQNPGTYFLTDFLLRSFEALVIKGLGLDRHPELKETYFKHYTRLVYLVQEEDPAMYEKAQWAADYLGLVLEIRPVHYGALESRLLALLADDDRA
jgi:hypothetical protein